MSFERIHARTQFFESSETNDVEDMCQSFPTETSIHCCYVSGAPKQPQSCAQLSSVPPGALGDRAFWEWQEQCSSCLAFEGSSSSPAGQAVPLLGDTCLARHSDFPGSQDCWVTPAWSPQEACLSLSRHSCHKCATLQLLESALLDQSCFVASAQLQLLPFQKECREMVGGGLKPEGNVLPTLLLSFFRVPLNCRHLRNEGWVV